MIKSILFSIFLFLFPVNVNATVSTTPTMSDKVALPVPFLWEIPDGVWVKPWNGACEEAAITGVDLYYEKDKTGIIKAAEGKKLMLPLFPLEDKLFGYNSDTNAVEIKKVIDEYTSYEAQVVRNPTLDAIKSELAAGRPVISLHYGYDLKNPRHRFRAGGSSFHVMVLTGYDDKKGVFTANDSELPDGIDYAYKYDTILTTLHDFNHKTKKADGPPTVIFTKPKELVKASGTSKVYQLKDGKKYYISSPSVFQNHLWSWAAVKSISKNSLGQIATGTPISK